MFMDDFKEAMLKITQSFESLAEAFAELFNIQEELSVDKGTSPKKYGKRKYKSQEKVHMYKCEVPRQKNLPYQRRSY